MAEHPFLIFFLTTLRHSIRLSSGLEHYGAGFDPLNLLELFDGWWVNDHMGHHDGEKLPQLGKYLTSKVLKNLTAVA